MLVTGSLPVLKGYVDTDQFVEDRMKRFPCMQCDCSFSMRTNLRRHVKKAHCQPLWRPIPSVKGSLSLAMFVTVVIMYLLLRPRPLLSAVLLVGLERYWHWVIGHWAIFADIG